MNIKITFSNQPKTILKYRRYYHQAIPFLKSRHATAYTMVILSLFTISFFGFFAIRPTLRTIVELKKQIEDSRIVDEALQKKINSLIIAQEEYQLVKNLIPSINNALPSQPDLTDILMKIENLVTSEQATISAINISPITYYPNPDNSQNNKKLSNETVSIDINISIIGDHYTQINHLLNKLLKTRRTILANNVDLIPIKANDQSLQLLLKVNTYYLK